jgi:peptidoglycan/xylan/chitin deacetylase (PgdA/CDA1 family)
MFCVINYFVISSALPFFMPPRSGMKPVPAPLSRPAWLSSKLDRLGILDRALWARARFGAPGLWVLTYHRIGALGDAGELDAGLMSADPAGFADQLALVQSHFRTVSMAEVRAALSGKGALPDNGVLITFDDGYADAYHTALPILTRASATATFFIPTAFPDSGRLFWWDRISLVMARCRMAEIELSYPRRMTLSPGSDPAGAASVMCRMIKDDKGLDLDRLQDELERATGVSLSEDEERALARRTIMSWSEVRALRDAGMDVQSHSHAHRVVRTLEPDEVARDLRRSRSILAEVLGEPPYAVSYPVGYRIDEPRRRAVARAGFELGFTNFSNVSPGVPRDLLNLPRINVPFGASRGLYKLILLRGERIHPEVAG